MFEVGDLVTVDSDVLRHHVHANTFEQWSADKIGIIVQVEGHNTSRGGMAILYKVHFQSLGNSYWMQASEVLPVTHLK